MTVFNKMRLNSARARLLSIVLCLAVFYFPALAAAKSDTGARLREVESKIGAGRKKARKLEEKSARIGQQLKRLAGERIQAARTAQKLEADVALNMARLKELARRQKAAAGLLDKRRGQFARVLAALSAMARNPPETIIVQPLAPADVVRSAILLRAAVPGIERQAKEIAATLAALTTARAETERRRIRLAAAMEGLKKNRARLDGLLARREKLMQSATAEHLAWARRVKLLTGKAKSLRDLMRRLEIDRKKRQTAARKKKGKDRNQARRRERRETVTKIATIASPAARQPGSMSKARGRLPFPAVGRLVGRYGDRMANGIIRKGVDIQTLPRAQVVAPFSGQVVFAGPFRGYGRLLIIEHGEGYHSLLAGLARIDTTLGETILVGEPVGVMGSPPKGRPVLYLELRRNGQPINPLPWLTAQR
jgi:septal ring factor EnvC (AmiA/AmiB activator)